MHDQGYLAVGQLRRQEALGTEGIYRVRGWDSDTVRVEVVKAPGLVSGHVFKLGRHSVMAMSLADEHQPSSPPEAITTPATKLRELRRSGRLPELLRLTPRSLCVVTLLLVVTDIGSTLAGNSVVPGGPLDELAHLASMMLVLWALGPRVCRPALWPVALIASVAIDVDHVPDRLGLRWLTAGTPRPYTHSLLSIAVVLLLAWSVRRYRGVFLAVALGLTIHFFRDLAEPGNGVSLLWPFSYQPVSVSHSIFRATMVVAVLIAIIRALTPLGPGRRGRASSLGEDKVSAGAHQRLYP